jgi:hypothetical protein
MSLLKNLIKNLSVKDKPDVPKEIGRNEDCWCGSGRKYKKCHLAEDERVNSARTTLNCGTT